MSTMVKEAGIEKRRIPTTEERASVRRILWTFWTINAAFGAAVPVLQLLPETKQGKAVSIGLAVVSMIVCQLFVRKRTMSEWISISMSASGMFVGASLGMVAAIPFRPTQSMILGLIFFGFAAALLTKLFLKELRREEEWALEAEADEREFEAETAMVAAMPEDEREAYLKNKFQTMHRELDELTAQMDKSMRKMKVLMAIGGVLLAGGILYRLFRS